MLYHGTFIPHFPLLS